MTLRADSTTGILVREAYWAPISAGEYDRRTGAVSINLTVVEAVHTRYGHASALIAATILAHERVHVQASDYDLPQEEERRAREAAILVGGIEVVTHIDIVLSEAWA